MNEVKREIGTDISYCLYHYKSLVLELLKVQFPYDTNEQHQKSSEKETSRIVKFLIERNLHEELEVYKQQYKIHKSSYLPLAEQVIFISDMELNPEYSLKSPKTLKNNELSLSLFYTTQSSPMECNGASDILVHEKWKNLPPPMETRTKAKEKENTSWSRDSSPDRNAFQTPSKYPNTPRYENVSQSSSNDGPYRSRRVTRGRFSPNSGRKRIMMRTNSGNFRSISRNRLFTTNRKGQYSPRRLSRSPSENKEKKCQLCFKNHREPCFKYGSIKPSEKLCQACFNGYHDKSICLEKRKDEMPKPESRNNSPGFDFNPHLN